MAWYEIILYILIIILIISALVSIHEAGHLIAAKTFNVYCFDYSIGFGPHILHVRRKGGETYFSLRVIPLGGFVSMYGEPGAVPEGFEEPDASRSLEAIAKWKKVIILLAGVTMNFLLGLTLIYVSDAAFPSYYMGYGGYAQGNSITLSAPSIPAKYEGEILSYVEDHAESYLEEGEMKKAQPEDYFVSALQYSGNYILDDEVVIEGSDLNYIAVYYPTALTVNHAFGGSIKLFPEAFSTTLKPEIQAAYGALGVEHFPDLSTDNLGKSKEYTWNEEIKHIDIDVHLVCRKLGEGTDVKTSSADAYANHAMDATLHFVSSKKGLSPANAAYEEDKGITVPPIKIWNNFAESWQAWADDVPRACTAIVKGFASLFTPGGFANLSGLVGMTAALPTVNAIGGAGYIFFFAGMISINLAFFNLLPFPGLDGWQLLVTIIEGITKKKVPAKLQGIMNFIGLGLLIGLALAVTIKDILALIL